MTTTEQTTGKLPRGHFLFTSESVTSGHPDKICDYLSDSILDACLSQDPESRVACESSCKNNHVSIFGEITTRAKLSVDTIARQAVKEIGYDSIEKGLDYKTCSIFIAVDQQSPDIANGIEGQNNDSQKKEEALLNLGAGDQGLMIGYATDETPELMPWTQLLAHRLTQRLQQVREANIIPWVRPDGKSQVTMEFKMEGHNLVPMRVHTVLISIQHDPNISQDVQKSEIIEKVIKHVIPANFLDADTLYYVNPSGRFVIGGPTGDAGVTGRKIIVDTYGGWAGHGGGAFSGKDATKVDRTGAYAARWIAKSLVAAGLCKRVMVQISYGIGLSQPLSVHINSFKTAKTGYSDDDLVTIVNRNFDLRPGPLIRDLKLREPKFKKLSSYGHFGRMDDPRFLWEVPKPLILEKDKKGKGCNGKDGGTSDFDEEYLKKFNSLKITRLGNGKATLPKKGEVNRLITSALPYVNNLPHLGTLIGCVLSGDVFARFSRLRGYNSIYICGTDEYGTATETQALKENLTPQELCKKYYDLQKMVYDWFDIDFDIFGRTSTDQQTKIAQDIFLKLHKNGYLLEDTVKQLYCMKCQRFLADRYVEGTCPKCGFEGTKGDQCEKCSTLYDATELKKPKCTICREGPEIRESKHIFLDLPKLTPELEKWAKISSEKGTWSHNSKAICMAWIKEGLKSRCITRDLKWGTQVPLDGFRDKVFYVWFDAPIGYLSITANLEGDWEAWWKNPENVQLYQFMGKDNVPFHTVIFPATLLGTGDNYTLLNHIATTEYLNYEDGKFSKSKGTGVFGDNAMETGIPSEVWRYYLLSNRPETSDAVFKWDDFKLRLNSELLANVGNLCQRSLMFAYSKFGQKIPDLNISSLTKKDLDLLVYIRSLIEKYLAALERVEIREGLKIANEISSICNKYMQDEAPWEKSKMESNCSVTIIGVLLNLLRVISAVYEPYMPSFSAKVNFILGFQERTQEDETILQKLADIKDPLEYLTLVPPGQVMNRPVPIFKELTTEECERFKKKYQGRQ